MIKRLEAPVLYVTDIGRSVAFYTGHLGFAVVHDSGDFVTLSVGGTKVALNRSDGKDKSPGAQTIILVSDAIVEDYQYMVTSGVEIDLPLGDLGYGRTFIVRDCDGNKVEVIE